MVHQQAAATAAPRILHVGIAERHVLAAVRTVFPHGHIAADGWDAWGEGAVVAIPGCGEGEGGPWHLRVTLWVDAPLNYLRRLVEAGVDLVPARDGVVALVTDGEEIEDTVRAQWSGQQIQDQIAIAKFNATWH